MDVFSTQYAHWHQFFEGLSVSPLDFYEKLMDELEERKVPEIKIKQIQKLEGGLLSNKRLYLRVDRRDLSYRLCAAPFGTGFFVSSRLVVSTLKAWILLMLKLAFIFLLTLAGLYVLDLTNQNILIVFLFLFLMALLLVVVVFLWFMSRRPTYYHLDTMLAFNEAIQRLFAAKVSEHVEAGGRKPLSDEERKPVMHKLLQRHAA